MHIPGVFKVEVGAFLVKTLILSSCEENSRYYVINVNTHYFLLDNDAHQPNETSGCGSPASNEIIFANVSANCEVCVRMGV